MRKLNEFKEWFGVDGLVSSKKLYKKGDKNPKKDLLIADVHRPFQHQTYYDKTIEDNLDCTNLWIAGDWWDFYSKSFYRKTASVDFKDEFRDGYIELWNLARKFNKVYVMLSNHDQRFKKWAFDNVPQELISFCYYNMVEDLIKTIPNVQIIKHQTASDRKLEYLYQHKNILLTHIEISRQDPMKVLLEIQRRLKWWKETYGLNGYDAIFQAHNHKSGKMPFGGVYLYHIPCLVDIDAPAFDYVFNGRMIGTPPQLGYIVLNKTGTGLIDVKNTHITDY